MQTGGTPRVVTGVEHEYKWLVTYLDVPGFDAGPHGVVWTVGMPAAFRMTAQVTTAQSSVYLDTADATLAAAGLSLAVLVNYGVNRHLRWLVLKETLLWDEGRRDALEIAERVDTAVVSEVVGLWSALPLVRLSRRFGGPLALRPVGATTQRRTQALASSDFGTLGMSVDETTIRDAAGREVAVDRWVEVETNQSDFRCLSGLAAWAALICDGLGTGPFKQSKPDRVAELAGAGHVG